jgi:hypothetical protein
VLTSVYVTHNVAGAFGHELNPHSQYILLNDTRIPNLIIWVVFLI